MNYHGEIMNIESQVQQYEYVGCQQHSYKEGHRDARHAAAEIALKADAEIESLKEELDYYYRLMDVLQDLPIDVDELLGDNV